MVAKKLRSPSTCVQAVMMYVFISDCPKGCFHIVHIQWNPSITDTFGEQSFGRYTEVAFVEGLFCIQTLHLGPVYLAIISQLAFLQGWPLRGVRLYTQILERFYLCDSRVSFVYNPCITQFR